MHPNNLLALHGFTGDVTLNAKIKLHCSLAFLIVHLSLNVTLRSPCSANGGKCCGVPGFGSKLKLRFTVNCPF